MVKLYEHYEQVLAKGCDKNCKPCDLYLDYRKECMIVAQKKWKAWAEKQHEAFGEVLRG